MIRCVFVFVLCSLSLLLPLGGGAQSTATAAKKGSFYFLWGYNKEVYTRSTLHFRNAGDPGKTDQFGVYDFKVHNVTAHDKAGFDRFRDIVNLTIPQFSFRLGYYFNNKRDEGFEVNYDHTKYVVTEGQTVRFTGTVFGQSIDKDSVLDKRYFHFEHTDGANFWHFNYLRRFDLLKNSPEKYKLKLVAKAGAGFVMPRTDITLFGQRLNNNWKIAGFCVGIESGLRAELWKHFLIETTGKLVYANYVNCLVQGRGNGKASHQFGCAEMIVSLGYQF